MNTPTADPPRLLIVEDSPSDRALYRRHLGDGFALAFAPSGEDALARLGNEPFDLVLLDFDLPGLDGGAVLDAIRGSMRADLPVVVVTGSGSEALAVDLLRRGASDYVTKTDLATPRIASVVAAALERDRLARERETAQSELLRQRDELAAALGRLQEAQAHLVQSEKMASLGQLVAGVAHEVNNPLAYVSNNLAVLARDVRLVAGLIPRYRALLPDPPFELLEAEADVDLPYTLDNLDRLVESSQRGLKRVREIVASLRDFSRLDEAVRKEIDPNEVVRDTLEFVRYAAKQKEVDLRVDLDPSPPPVWCSPGQLNQVLLNILLNAIQAVEPGHRVEVRTRSDPARGEVRYEVADDGPGIPASIRGRIFDPFFTTKPPGVGTGLGLWVSYNIAKEHGGRIDVASEPGRGTTFSVVLPTGQPS
jgi:signal transduction histidine kinase